MPGFCLVRGDFMEEWHDFEKRRKKIIELDENGNEKPKWKKF